MIEHIKRLTLSPRPAKNKGKNIQRLEHNGFQHSTEKGAKLTPLAIWTRAAVALF